MEAKNNLPMRQSDTAVAERTPEAIAAEINFIKEQAYATTVALVRSVHGNAVEIGRRLEEAKCLVPHGEWGAWLEANVSYSESQAHNLMKCYREYGDTQIDMLTGTSDADFYATLTVSQMVALFPLSRPERRAFVEGHREELASGEMSIRDMKAEVARLTVENEALRGAPPPEPVVQEVFVNQPTAEQIEKLRAEAKEAAKKEVAEKEAAEKKAVKAELDAASAGKKRAEDALDTAKKEKEKAEAALAKAMKEREKAEAALGKAEEAHKAELEQMKATHAKELEEASKTSQVDTTAMEEATARIAELEKALRVANPAVSEFKALFDAVQGMVRKLREKLGAIRKEDPETADKLSKAMEMLARVMGGGME